MSPKWRVCELFVRWELIAAISRSFSISVTSSTSVNFATVYRSDAPLIPPPTITRSVSDMRGESSRRQTTSPVNPFTIHSRNRAVERLQTSINYTTIVEISREFSTGSIASFPRLLTRLVRSDTALGRLRTALVRRRCGAAVRSSRRTRRGRRTRGTRRGRRGPGRTGRRARSGRPEGRCRGGHTP
ncbi:hypothetical protein BN903_55 [Halorubrum sp. AJ67]|nr:hypothetical protein BN903_55 [Halorubrum sp. AJ67]